VPAHSPVIPLVIGPEAATMEAARKLLAAGFHVGAIRPPTVPAGTCRLRVSLSAAHSERDIDELADAIEATCGGAALTPLPHLAAPPPWSAKWLAAQDALDAAAAAGGGWPAEAPAAGLSRALAAAGGADAAAAPPRSPQQRQQQGRTGSGSGGGGGGSGGSSGAARGSGGGVAVAAEGVHFAPLRPRSDPRQRGVAVRSRL
jgi:uncharacterized membrane protein YgcG